MKVGLLWFDGDLNICLETRITRAAMYYNNKYGRYPNLCIINPATAGEIPPRSVTGLDVQLSPTVQPDHFWLGIDDQEKCERGVVQAAA